MLTAAILSLLIAKPAPVAARDTLKESYVVTSAKHVLPEGKSAVNTTSLYLKEIQSRGVKSPKALSSIIPNLHIPDYGSAMTSTVYMRGLGSRMENPSIGLYIDDFPVMDKNAYDFSFLDIRKAEMLAGPQGTLYGRNSIAGLLEISTLSSDDFNGRIFNVEAGSVEGSASASFYNGKASSPKGGYSVSLGTDWSRGYYTNAFNGEKCDRSFSLKGRGKYEKYLGPQGVRLSNTLSVSWIHQGGYPYRRYLTDSEISGDERAELDGADRFKDGYLLPIDYNDDCAYRRLFVMDGLKLSGGGGNVSWHSMTSAQILLDRMDMDQDFTPESMFTLRQSQRQINITQEFVLKPKVKASWWDSQSGVFLFLRRNRLEAPVTFKEDGIRSLILDNANRNIPSWLGTLSFKEDTFPIESLFHIGTFNTAVYHESYFNFGRWLLTAGIRADIEGNSMDYDSGASLDYIISPAMTSYRAYDEVFKGNEKNFYVKLLPKVSALYDAGPAKVYASVSRGYRSGGFNTQIFSDILRNLLMTGMMEDVGIYPDNPAETSASSTSYKPETSINYEVGARYGASFPEGRFDASVSLFRIDCRNQQITVFPDGQSTGRMMANAGSSRSNGVEVSAHLRWRTLSLSASYGYTDAVFKKYDNGREDYSGNKVPYAPANTLSVRALWEKKISHGCIRGISAALETSGVGKIYWNEENTLSEKFKPVFGGDCSLDFPKFTVFARADNILNAKYRTFYFKSVGESFFQEGKGGRFSIGIRITK